MSNFAGQSRRERAAALLESGVISHDHIDWAGPRVYTLITPEATEKC